MEVAIQLAERISYLRNQEQSLVSEVADLRAKLKETRAEMGMLLDELLIELLENSAVSIGYAT